MFLVLHHLPKGSSFWFSMRHRDHWRAFRLLIPHAYGHWHTVFRTMFSIHAVYAFTVHVMHIKFVGHWHTGSGGLEWHI